MKENVQTEISKAPSASRDFQPPQQWGLLRRAFAWIVFPTFLCGTIGATIWQMNLGIDPALAFLGPAAATYLVVMVLERLIPYRREWNRARGDIRVDLSYLIFSGGLTLELLRPFMLALGVGLGGWLSSRVGATPWPANWPLLAQFALALVVGEFFLYWIHRLGHTWAPLWRFHAAHHSAPRLYFLNAVRFHSVDMALANFGPFIPLVALGADERVLALFALFSAVHGIFQHANIPILLGPLNWIFSMSELHRWHHSLSLKEANTNYGQNLIVWDVVFGTRFLPTDREPPEEIGIVGMPNFPTHFMGQFLAPFTWARLMEKNPLDETES